MTHWVIRGYEGRIYAGADTLSSGPDYPSELSGTGVMPNVHDQIITNKLAKHSWTDTKECIICCAGKSFLFPKVTTYEPKKNAEVMQDILKEVDVSNISNASELMQAAMLILTDRYLVDKDKNSVVLGCGFSDGLKNTIAYYDSRQNLIKSVSTQYCNSELVTNEQSMTVSSSMTGDSPAEFSIQREIFDKSIERPGRVGQAATLKSLKKVNPSHQPGSFKSGLKDDKKDGKYDGYDGYDGKPGFEIR